MTNVDRAAGSESLKLIVSIAATAPAHGMRSHDVHCNPVKPCAERAVAAEPAYGAIRAHERVLHEILGVSIAVRQNPDQLKHARLVPSDQFVKRFTTTSRGFRHERFIYIHKGSSFGRLAASQGLDWRAADPAAR